MTATTAACAGARLTGNSLSGRERGGGVWSIDLADVAEAIYCEHRGLSQTRLSLRLKTSGTWREVAVTVPARNMARSRDVTEHRALVAQAAERLAELHPGFRIEYRIVHVPARPWVAIAAGVCAALFAMGMVAWLFQSPVLVAVVLSVGLTLIALAGVAILARKSRRASDVSAAALPGILTAAGRRE